MERAFSLRSTLVVPWRKFPGGLVASSHFGGVSAIEGYRTSATTPSSTPSGVSKMSWTSVLSMAGLSNEPRRCANRHRSVDPSRPSVLYASSHLNCDIRAEVNCERKSGMVPLSMVGADQMVTTYCGMLVHLHMRSAAIFICCSHLQPSVQPVRVCARVYVCVEHSGVLR